LFGDSDNTTRRRLIWAYDEAQSLESLVAPTHRELFGDAVSEVMLADSPIYTGGINKNEVMRKCYRTPGQILVAAHAIGMGLFREGGMLSGLTTQEDWRSLGYEVQGDFRRVGEMIHLERPPENSLNIVADLYGKPVLTFQPFASRTDEIDVVAEQIKQDIMQEGLKASRELLVIALGEPWEASKIQETMARALQQRGIDYFVPATPKPNMLKADKDNRKPDKFWYEGAVTVSRIHQAKGNEADVVYVLGFDNIAKREADVNARNQVFVALTRTKGWAHLSGVGEHPLFDEMKTVIKSKQAFSFVFRRSGSG
jgi:superfamily I DNA and RNA helicase